MEPEIIEFIFSQNGMNRQTLREKVVNKFFQERPGPVEYNDTYSRYEYIVERTQFGNVVLIRPANLKLGFDFRIDVKFWDFGNGKNAPSHINIFEDLKEKHTTDTDFAEEVRLGILQVLNMEDPDDVLQNIQDKNIGLPVELILKISKWFAVEMDIRYWNGWGRNKYKLWLDLMKLFQYNFNGVDTGYNFFDDNGKKCSEKKATKLFLESQEFTSITQYL